MLRLLRVTRSSLLRYSIGLLVIAAALLFLWPELIGNLFATGYGEWMFMSHGHCYLWVPSLVTLHVSTDLFIGISYTAISITLAYLVHRARRDIPFHWIFLAFGLFIVACGATHFMEVVTLWNATYWLSGYVKLVTAAASVATAVMLPAVVPKTLLLVRDAKTSDERKQELERANRRLEEELARRMRAEESLQQTNQVLEAIFQSSPLAIYAFDLDGKVLMWNTASERIFGWSEQEVIGHPLPIISQDEQGEFRQLRERVLWGGAFTNVETHRRKKDGSPIDVSISTAPLRDANGNIDGIVALTADITERKRTEEALRESEERYRALVENANDIIYAYDLTGRFISVNRTGERVTGYTREEILRMNIADVVAPEHLEQAQRRIAEMVAGGVLGNYEFEIIAKDGSRVTLEVNSRVSLHGDVAVGIQGIARDITDRKRAEEALRESEERFRLLVEGIRDYAIFMLDTEGRIASWNEGAERLKGYRPDEAIGQPHTLCSTAEDITEGTPTRALQVAATEGRYEDETLLVRKDGSRFRANLIITALRDAEGHLRGFVDVTRDITERMQAEEALRTSEELFRGLLQLLPVGVYSCDRDGLLKHYNRRAVELWARLPALNDTDERFCGSFKMYWPDGTFIPRDQVPMAEVLRTGVEIRGIEAVFERPDHSRITIELYIIPLKDTEGNVTGAINCFQDISERKRRMEALRESERQLAAAQQVAHLGSWELDVATQRVTWSEEMYRVYGLRHEEFNPSFEGFLERVHPDDRERVKKINEKAFRDHQPFSFDHRIVNPDGTVRTLHGRGELITDETGKPVKLRGIGQDITERKQAEAERDIERQLLKALIDQLPVGVLVSDMEGRYIKANHKICEILGTGCDELIGMTIDEVRQLVNPTTPEGTPLTDTETPTALALRTQHPIKPIESIITTPGGEVRRISSNAVLVVIDGGAPFGSVTVVADVTEQYILQEQLRQSQKMESIGTLAGGVAHDFNNLLTVILGNTQLAFRGIQPGTPLQERLFEIERAGTRATTLTRQLLAFSRRQRLERQSVNLNETINDFMKMLRRVIGEDIEVRIQESVRLDLVFADPAQIEQVVMNLAVNARDAMPGGGNLTIETRNVELEEAYQREHPYAKPGRYVQISVSDTGVGMDTETKERIFEPFFTTKETGKGTGLGLSMVYGIIKQHGGLIEVESELGRGATFHIYLPVDEKAVKEEAQEVLPPLRGGTETILVAEDEEALRALTRTVLEELGYTVLLAKDGAEAVEVYEANSEKIALLLFDIVMPRMGGREAYERISSPNDPVPVIFMTGYSAEIVQYEFVKQNKFIEEAGAALMQKPYTVETLGRKVRETLDGMRKRHQYSQS
jgi:PAS domain S-box-containing protein